MKLIRASAETAARQIDAMRSEIERNLTPASTKFLDLGVRVVRILNYSSEFTPLMERQLTWSLRDTAERYDATLVLWTTQGLRIREKDVVWVLDETWSRHTPVLMVNGEQETITAFDKRTDTYYYGAEHLEPEEAIKQGHLFVQLLNRILKTPDTNLIHGACIGLNGKGVLLCARGQQGKSTLAVHALLDGFEYVSDDYLTLEKSRDGLLAYPIYSIVTLSPQMYNEMYEALQGTRFVSNNARRDKYVLNIANLHARFRTAYPVQVCMLPEIFPGAEPSITRCLPAEKGAAITRLVHSTISQMEDRQDTATVKKLIGMVRDFDFYKIRLCRDIYKNVACLRAFLLALK